MKNFISRVPRFIYIAIIIMLIITQPIYYKYKHSNNNLSAYKITRTTDDLAITIENFSFVAIDNGLLIQPGHSIRTSEHNPDKIENVRIRGYIKGKLFHNEGTGVLNQGISDPGHGRIDDVGPPTFIPNIKVDNDSILNLRINYSLNGEEKEFSEDLNLKEFKAGLVEW